MSETDFRGEFAKHGFWQKTEGMFVLESPGGEIVGHIEFLRPVSYWDAFELSYQIYADQYAGRGFVTEPVQLLVDYLFAAKKENRVHLVIAPENSASRRIAEKCGFVLEGTVRGAFFPDGRNQDVLLYSLLRSDPRPWNRSAASNDRSSDNCHGRMHLAGFHGSANCYHRPVRGGKTVRIAGGSPHQRALCLDAELVAFGILHHDQVAVAVSL